MDNKKYIILIVGGAAGVLLGGTIGSMYRGQNINWMFVALNIALVSMLLAAILYKKKDGENAEGNSFSWIRKKKKKKK